MKYIALCFILFSSLWSHADEGHESGRTQSLLKGIVTDAQGAPIAGVLIRLEGNDHSFYTDFEGKFSIPASQQSAIEFIYAAHAPLKVSNLSPSLPEHPVLHKIVLQD